MICSGVVELLCEVDNVTMDDIRDELRASKLLNPKNVERTIEMLRAREINI